jgi:hypothetical protein
VCFGVIASLVAGAVIVYCGRFVALPWSFSALGGYVWIRVLLPGGAGFGFGWCVAAACERAGGMTSVVFEAFAALSAACLGVALARLAASQARLLVGETASFPEVILLVAAPTVVGALIAIGVRRS